MLNYACGKMYRVIGHAIECCVFDVLEVLCPREIALKEKKDPPSLEEVGIPEPVPYGHETSLPLELITIKE